MLQFFGVRVIKFYLYWLHFVQRVQMEDYDAQKVQVGTGKPSSLAKHKLNWARASNYGIRLNSSNAEPIVCWTLFMNDLQRSCNIVRNLFNTNEPVRYVKTRLRIKDIFHFRINFQNSKLNPISDSQHRVNQASINQSQAELFSTGLSSDSLACQQAMICLMHCQNLWGLDGVQCGLCSSWLAGSQPANMCKTAFWSDKHSTSNAYVN